jgi:hypothetical protein
MTGPTSLGFLPTCERRQMGRNLTGHAGRTRIARTQGQSRAAPLANCSHQRHGVVSACERFSDALDR